LKPAELRTEAERIRDETKALAEVICAPSLEETSNQILKAALRNRLVKRIDGIVQELAEKTRRLEREFEEFPSLYDDKEVWVWFFTAEGTPKVGYDVATMGKVTGPLVAIQMREEGAPHMRPGPFLELIKNLKEQILAGSYDEKLSGDPARIIYELL
jgi:hypothetical protein